MRGILSWGTYLPYWRLDRSTIAPVAGSGGGKGTRTAASYDEDTTTLGVEAARRALRSAPDAVTPGALWFATVAPAYADKTNATAIHAALRLDRATPAYDAVGSVRSAVGAVRAALDSRAPTLVTTADIRTGMPGGADETAGGDAAAALLIGDETDGPVVAELVGSAGVTEEFLDRWRTPGEQRSKVWEERFGEEHYVVLGTQAWAEALKDAGLTNDGVHRVVIAGTHERAARSVVKAIGVPADRVGDSLAATVGNTGAAHPALTLARALEQAAPNEVVAQVVLADGADVLLWRTTDAIARYRSAPSLDEQVASGGALPYGKYLAWRGWLPVEPPRRPEPSRPSASAAARSSEWKFAFTASEGEDGSVHMPPSPLDDASRQMADRAGVIRTFTVDRIAYSPSPPIVFAVVDFDGGGRSPVELTDVNADEVAIGGRVEMTFRRLFTADGIHNYFYKARPVRGG